MVLSAAVEPASKRPSTSEPAGRGWWSVVLVAGLAGIGFTGTQIVEKITILGHPDKVLLCDVNSVMSCTNVLNAWQSSVLGPPNALIGAVMFALLASAGLAGVLGTTFTRPYLLTLWGLAVFFLAFATWFMYETAFSIGALCLWCTGIVTAVVAICLALTRVNQAHRTFGEGRGGERLDTAVRSQSDLIVWAGWWLAVALLVWTGLAL